MLIKLELLYSLRARWKKLEEENMSGDRHPLLKSVRALRQSELNSIATLPQDDAPMRENAQTAQCPS